MVQNHLRPPRFIIQPDWDDALKEGDDEIWFSFKQNGESVHSKLHKCRKNDSSILLTSSNPNVEADVKFGKTLKLRHTLSELQSTFYAPTKTFGKIHGKSIQSLDVNVSGLGASASYDGRLLVWENLDGTVRRSLEGHVGDVYCTKFFPSGLVLLSAGADMMIKIWAVDNGRCVQDLIGHRQAINDVAFIDKGRNIVSGSKDGTCRLWDCGSAKCITVVGEDCGQINSLALTSSQNVQTNVDPNDIDAAEVGTNDKIVCLGCENGFLRSFALGNREKMTDMKLADAINCLTFVSSDVVVCGTQSGSLIGVDLRKSNEPLYTTDEDRGPVLSLTSYSKGFFVSFNDGTVCYKSSAVENNLRGCPAELTGADCDPIYRVVYDEKFLYTCCRDTKIRKYKLPNVV